VAFAVVAQRIPLAAGDIALLGELLAADGGDSAALTQVPVAQVPVAQVPVAPAQVTPAQVTPAQVTPAQVAQAQVALSDPPPPYRFGPAPPDAPAPPRPDDAPLDEVDRAAVAAVAAEAGAHGLWRAWRYPADEAPWPPPRRIYLVETADTADLVELTARIQRHLAAAGETDPQVEVFPTAAELPSYQRSARAYAGLIWARTPAPEIKIATVFDEVDAETGPRFAAWHERLADEVEARRVLDYLNAGEPLLVTSERLDDVVDPSRRNAVPMNFRTDGSWIWTDTTTYYLEWHGLSPDTGLLAHVRATGYRMPPVDGVAIHRAMAVLQEPSDEQPAWTYDGTGDGPEDG
jgi:hypothetical protein